MATFCPYCNKEIEDAVHGIWWVENFLKRFEMKCPECWQMLEIDVESLPVFLPHKKAGKGEKVINGWYYLHTHGELIFKPNLPGMAADIRESDFAVMLWPADTDDRECAWRILVEALACGADLDRVKKLAAKWRCDNVDAQFYADRVGVHLSLDGSSWFAARRDFVNLQESLACFGDTALEAMAELCKRLGYKPRKMWGGSFADLLK